MKAEGNAKFEWPSFKVDQNVRRRFGESRGKIKCISIYKTEIPEISNIDKLGRIALPLGYIMFNIYYWIKYLGTDDLKKFPR